MGLVSKTWTFSSGAVIVAAQHNTNFDTLYNLVNGNIDSDNLSASANIKNTQLLQITTAGKVDGAAITGLASLPSGAGVVPLANLPVGPTVTALADGAGSVIDSTLGKVFTMVATADRTLGTTTGAVNGQAIIIRFTASGGARTLTLPTSTTGDFAYGSDITILTQTASGKTDLIGCIYSTTANRYHVVAYVKGF